MRDYLFFPIYSVSRIEAFRKSVPHKTKPVRRMKSKSLLKRKKTRLNKKFTQMLQYYLQDAEEEQDF